VTGYHWSHSWPQSQVACRNIAARLGLNWVAMSWKEYLGFSEVRLLELMGLGLRYLGLFGGDILVSYANDWSRMVISLKEAYVYV